MKNLDAKDREILQVLQTDGRITNADLAKRVSLSPPSVLQRVRHLERAGYITRYAAHLDPQMLNLKITVFALVSLALHEENALDGFIAELTEIPQVLECHHVSGEFDFLLKIVVQDMRTYEELLRNRLLKIKGLGQIRSSFVLATPKSTTDLPIDAA